MVASGGSEPLSVDMLPASKQWVKPVGLGVRARQREFS